MMQVALTAYTPDPDEVVAVAARLCYSDLGRQELRQQAASDQSKRLLDYLRQAGHLSPLEHAVFTFHIEGISRVTTHQLVRHRVASYSQQSQRYVRADASQFVIPPSIKRSPRALNEYRRLLEQTATGYQRLLDLGIPGEDARYCLSQAVTSKLVLTMNARQLLHVFQLRTCRRAQWEIRNLTLAMLRQVREVAPVIFKDAGPECVVLGQCKQGKYSCGDWRRAARKEQDSGTD